MHDSIPLEARTAMPGFQLAHAQGVVKESQERGIMQVWRRSHLQLHYGQQLATKTLPYAHVGGI